MAGCGALGRQMDEMDLRDDAHPIQRQLKDDLSVAAGL